MKGDNRGMTLVEMMAAVMISVLITGAAGIFIHSALKGYQSASNAIDFQMESQVLMEQFSTWIMEGNRVEVSSYDDSDDPDGDGTSKVLIIYTIPDVPEPDREVYVDGERVSPADSAGKRFIWQHGNGLYMIKKENIAVADLDTVTVDYGTEAVRDCCISEYIEEFEPDYDSTADPRPEVVDLRLTLSKGLQEYEVSNEFQIRNDLR